MRKGMVHIYTGNGKGKTTAALGLGLRAAGRGLSVCMFQFLKKRGVSGEAATLKKLRRCFKNVCFNQVHPMFVAEKEEKKAKEKIQCSMPKALEIVWGSLKKYDVVILDEIICAVKEGFLDEAVLICMIKSKPKKVELVLTGRGASAKLISAADYVSDIRDIKHPYYQGVRATRGIEY